MTFAIQIALSTGLFTDWRDFSRERNAQDSLLSDMGFKPASEIEPPADRRVAQKKTPTVSRNSREIAEAISIDSL